MKRIVVLMIFMGCITIAYSQNLGLGIQVIPESGLIGIQARGAYHASDLIAISGAYNYYFKKGTNFSLDFDAQFKILQKSNFNIAPFAGINLTKRSSTSINTGLQLGFFVVLPRDGTNIYFEPKAILDQETVLSFTGGLYF